MKYLYEASESPKQKESNSSWPYYYKGKDAPYFFHKGYFVQGKRYIVEELPDNDKKLKVSGFFKMVFSFQKFISPGRLKDITFTAKSLGYYELNFDKETCAKFLKFIKKLP